ncbi:MAG: hypothetical protein ABIA74_03160 [bacterium]
MTEETILSVLGKISEKVLLDIFESLIDQNVPQLLKQLVNINFQSLNPQIFWNSLIQTCRNLMWVKYETDIKNRNFEKLKKATEKCSINRIHAIFQLLWNQEPIFLQTSQKHIFLESVLIQICEQTKIEDLTELIENCKNQNINSDTPPIQHSPKYIQKNPVNTQQEQGTNSFASTTNNSDNHLWNQFLEKINNLSDHMISSILKQATFIKENKENKVISIGLHNDNQFLRDQIEESKPSWITFLQETFPEINGFEFEKVEKKETSAPAPQSNIKQTQNDPQNTRNYPSQSYNPQNHTPQTIIDISDKEKWPKANLIIQHFPGKIKLSK